MRRRLLALAPLLIIAGCDDASVIQRDREGRNTGLMIYTDAVTGCQYLRPFTRDGLQPRMGKDGKQICS